MAANNNAGYGREIDQTGYGLPGTGLLSNRNDIRQAMALKLLDNQMPAEISGRGATIAASLGGVAKAFAMGKLLSDSQDEKDAARSAAEADRENEKAQADKFAARRLAGAAPADPPAMADTLPAAPAPETPAPTGGGITPPSNLLPIYQQASQASGVPVSHLVAQGNIESSFKPDAIGKDGEWGIAQIHPKTAADPGYGMQPISQADAMDPAKAIPWQAQYLAARGKAAGVTDWSNPDQARRGFAAYNGAGPNAANYGNRVVADLPRVQLGTPGAAADAGGGDDPFAGAGMGAAPSSPALAGPRPTGPALAARMDVATGIPGAAAPGQPTGAQLAARLTPERVAAMEKDAADAAASPYGMISRQAPGLMMDARQARAQLERQQQLGDARTAQQQRDAERAQDRADAQAARGQDAAERQRMALDARVPNGYRWNADRSGMEFVPGGPADPKNLAPPKPEGSAFGNSADGHALDIMNRLGARYRDGSASPDERQLYETAATHYTQPKAQVTERGVVQITPQLPPGMPAPGQFGPQAAPQQQAGQGAVPGPASAQPGPTASPPALPGTTPVPGVRVVQNDQRDPPEKMLGAMLGNVDALRRTQAAVDSLNGNPGAVGPGVQFFPNLANWFDPGGTATRAMVADIGSLKLHDRSGAAITASEMPRLTPFIPSIGDTKAAAMDKLGKFQNEYRTMLSDQYEVHGPKSGYRALRPVERVLNPTDPANAPTPGQQGAAPAPSRVPAPPPGFRIIGGG